MLFLIHDGQLSGTTVSAEDLPAGFKAVNGPDLPVERLYWDGERVVEKPAQPSPLHSWNAESRSWQATVAVAALVAQNSQNWEGLIDDLRNTPVFGKVYGAATQPEAATVAALTKTLKANTAYTLLMDTLGKTHNLGDLQFAIAQLREVMRSIGAIGDFTATELAWLNRRLQKNGFELRLEAHDAA